MRHLKNLALNVATALVTVAAVVMVGIRVNQQFLQSRLPPHIVVRSQHGVILRKAGSE